MPVVPCLLCEIHRDVYSRSLEGLYLYLLLSDSVSLSVRCRSCRGEAVKGELLIVLLAALLMHLHGLTSISNHFGFHLFFPLHRLILQCLVVFQALLPKQRGQIFAFNRQFPGLFTVGSLLLECGGCFDLAGISI